MATFIDFKTASRTVVNVEHVTQFYCETTVLTQHEADYMGGNFREGQEVYSINYGLSGEREISRVGFSNRERRDKCYNEILLVIKPRCVIIESAESSTQEATE